MSYENDCRGVGDRNPRFVVVERDGVEARRYGCRTCNAMFDVAPAPSHKPVRVERWCNKPTSGGLCVCAAGHEGWCECEPDLTKVCARCGLTCDHTNQAHAFVVDEL